MTEPEVPPQEAQIKIIGMGHSGSVAVEQMIECNAPGVEFIHVHSSTRSLPKSNAHRSLGGDTAAAAMQDILAAISNTGLLFITAGMDCGADTLAAAAIAQAARKMNIVTVGLAIASCENPALAELQAHVDSLIVANDSNAHFLFKDVVREIAAILNEYNCVNVDINDVRTVMREPGRAMMGSAQASGPDRARIAATQATEGMRLLHAKAMLVLVTAAKGSLRLSESRLAMDAINAFSSPTANIIYGVASDDALGDSVRVSVVATGLDSP